MLIITEDKDGNQVAKRYDISTPDGLEAYLSDTGLTQAEEVAEPAETLVPTIEKETLTENEQYRLMAIEASREEFASGAVDMATGLLRMTRSLVILRDNNRWLHDPIIAHLEEPTWGDYMRELVGWAKDKEPKIQLSLSGLNNALRYWYRYVEGLGLDEEAVFGAQEKTRRELDKMAVWTYGFENPKPLRLKDGYDIEKLPMPTGFEGDESEKLREGLKGVAETVFALDRYDPKVWTSFKRGNGKCSVKVGFKIKLREGMIEEFIAFVEKYDENHNPTADFYVDVTKRPVPYEVLDAWAELGWEIEEITA